MKLFGSPGTRSGLALRVLPAVCGFVSGILMLTSFGYSAYTEIYIYVILEILLQSTYSFIQICSHVYCLVAKKDLDAPLLASFFLLGDTITMLLTFSATSVSAGVTVFFVRDTALCRSFARLACGRFQLSVLFSSIACFFQAVSTFSVFWVFVALLNTHAE